MGLETKILSSIYSRCGVTSENVISLRWRPFWKWRKIGSPSQFSDGGIDFSCWDKSQCQNKIAFVSSWLVYVGYIASVEPIVQLMWFLLVSKAAILNLELTKSHRDFCSVIIGFLLHINIGLDTKILSIYLRNWVIGENVIPLISMATILKMASHR